MPMSYIRFAGMIAMTTFVMLGLIYLNSFAADPDWFSQTPIWMALYMGAAMAAVMLSFMLGMYRHTRLNAAIFVAAALVFAGSLYLVRSQDRVGGETFVQATIPQQPIAIPANSRARLNDPRMRDPADAVIETKRPENALMETLIADLNGGPWAMPEAGGR